MTTANPYQTPSADLSQIPETGVELAGRGARLGAAMIDGILQMLVLFPLLFLFGVVSSFSDFTTFGLVANLLIALGSFAVYVLLNGYLLKQNGQTIGKKLLGLRIVTLDNQLPALPDILLKRQLPWFVVNVIPVIGQFLPLINVLFIFRADRRCLHDQIAGTKVIVAG